MQTFFLMVCLFFTIFFCLCLFPPAEVAFPMRLLSCLLNAFCCFFQLMQHQSQFHIHSYCTLFFSAAFPMMCLPHASPFHHKSQVVSLNIFFANSIPTTHMLKERERERDPVKSRFVQIHFIFLDSLYTPSCHFSLSMASSFFSLISRFLYLSLPRHVWSPTSSSCQFKIQSSLKHHYFFLKTCPYHRAPLIMASPFKVSFKPSNLASSWVLFSIISTPHIALIIAFSFFLKIAISFPLRHYVSLSYSIADLKQL